MRCTLSVAIFLLSLLIAATGQQPGRSGTSHEAREKVPWAPRQFPVFDPKRAWTKPKVMVTSLHAPGLSVELEQTDIRKTAERYGAKLGSSGDASDYVQWLCFVGGKAQQKWVLWLSSGEIDGDLISDFSIQRINADAEVDSRCGKLSEGIDEPVTAPLRLRLGMNESDLRSALGVPTARRGEFLYYAHSHDFQRQNEPYTLMNTVTVRVKDGVVRAMEVWKSTQS